MTAAVIALVAVVAIQLGWLIQLYATSRSDEKAAIAQGLELQHAKEDVARLTDENARLLDRCKLTEAALAAERRKVTDAKVQAVANAEPGDAGAAVDRMLDEEAAAQRARRASHAPPPAVSTSGAASDGPRPAWVDLASDGG